jgi:hypothetical protein
VAAIEEYTVDWAARHFYALETLKQATTSSMESIDSAHSGNIALVDAIEDALFVVQLQPDRIIPAISGGMLRHQLIAAGLLGELQCGYTATVRSHVNNVASGSDEKSCEDDTAEDTG